MLQTLPICFRKKETKQLRKKEKSTSHLAGVEPESFDL